MKTHKSISSTSFEKYSRWLLPQLAYTIAALALTATLGLGSTAQAADSKINATSLSLPRSGGSAFADANAAQGKGLVLWSNASASGQFTSDGSNNTLSVRAKGDQCGGAPRMVISVDGTKVLETEVAAVYWNTYSAPLTVPAGVHSVSIAFVNDRYQAGSCDRNLRLDTVAITSASTALQGEHMVAPNGSGQNLDDQAASGRRTRLMWSNATATGTLQTNAPASQLKVRARGSQCQGAPQVTVSVDGRVIARSNVTSNQLAEYRTSGGITAGTHRVSVAFTNDYLGNGCDRNLYLDVVTAEPEVSTPQPPMAALPIQAEPATAPVTAPILDPTPLASPVVTPNPAPTPPPASVPAETTGNRSLYVEADSNAKRQANALRSSRSGDAAQLDKIANQPRAIWLGGWNKNVTEEVKHHVKNATAQQAVPTFVLYNIPQRDCGQYSAGGAHSAESYQRWIANVAHGLGSGPAIVIVEPDALTGIDCLSATDRTTRLSLLQNAVTTLSAHPGTMVYLDGGHSKWKSPAETASRLTAAGVAGARGFSLNVSNFQTTANETAFGGQVSTLLGGKRFVIDTSRNGAGPGSGWCNPSGRALGERPNLTTAHPYIDAYLWVKAPGESDGTCNGGPAAGQFWTKHALDLTRRASY